MKTSVTIFKQYHTAKVSEFQESFLLTGITYGDCQTVIRTLEFAEELDLIPDPENKFDDSAVRVCTKNGLFVGWVPGKNEIIFKTLMEGITLKGIAAEMILPNKEFNFYNVKIQVYRIDLSEKSENKKMKSVINQPVLHLTNRDYDDWSRIFEKARQVAIENNMDWEKIYNQVKGCYTESLLQLKLSKHFNLI